VINLSKINQDVNEKQNGNARQEGGGTNAPTQVHVMASVDNSAGMRVGWGGQRKLHKQPSGPMHQPSCTETAASQETMFCKQIKLE
jgi:hypothetical protein